MHSSSQQTKSHWWIHLIWRGSFSSTFEKQKLNTKSLTESEIVGVSDFLPKVMFIDLFLAAQGFPLKENIVHQDNESAIKLEVNGRRSCGKRTCYVDTRCFHVKDLVGKKRVTFKHYPTEKMLADFLPSHCKENCSAWWEASFYGKSLYHVWWAQNRHYQRSILRCLFEPFYGEDDDDDCMWWGSVNG